MVPTRSPELPKPSRTPGKKPKTYILEPNFLYQIYGKNPIFPIYSIIKGPIRGDFFLPSTVYPLVWVKELAAWSVESGSPCQIVHGTSRKGPGVKNLVRTISPGGVPKKGVNKDFLFSFLNFKISKTKV